MEGPVVTIALPVLNAEKTLIAAIQSIIQQTYTSWELLVLDDGSCDRSVAIARSFSDSRIHILEDGVNRGISARLNEAIDMAQGQYYARFDADDIAFPYRIEKQVRFMEQHPEVDLLGTGVLVFAADGGILGRIPVKEAHQEICAAPWRGFYMPHPTWLGRIEWFRKFRYDSNADRSEDQHLLFRAFRSSQFACLPDVLLGYREERRMLRKMLSRRLMFSRSIIGEALMCRCYATAIKVAGIQLFKIVGDFLNIGFGVDKLRNPLLPVDSNLTATWVALWSATVKRHTGILPSG